MRTGREHVAHARNRSHSHAFQARVSLFNNPHSTIAYNTHMHTHDGGITDSPSLGWHAGLRFLCLLRYRNVAMHGKLSHCGTCTCHTSAIRVYWEAQWKVCVCTWKQISSLHVETCLTSWCAVNTWRCFSHDSAIWLFSKSRMADVQTSTAPPGSHMKELACGICIHALTLP
jgi:hypothetical protein